MWSSLLGKKKDKPQAKAAAPARRPEPSAPPPITSEETGANLSDLERKLNREMKCPAGMNQVFIRSLVTAQGASKPRIALKCHLRRDVGLPADVFYEHVRDVCCSNPDSCEAYKKFKDRFVPT